MKKYSCLLYIFSILRRGSFCCPRLLNTGRGASLKNMTFHHSIWTGSVGQDVVGFIQLKNQSQCILMQYEIISVNISRFSTGGLHKIPFFFR